MKTTTFTPDRALDLRALKVFLSLAFALSWLASAPVLLSGSLAAWDGWALVLLMWAPGLAAIATSLAVYRSLAPLGLTGQRNTWGWALLGLATPVAYTLLIYGALAGLGWVTLGHANLQLAIIAPTLFGALRLALGEEIGWRGLASPLLGRLMGFVPGQVVLGFIWFLYHLPLLLFSDYGKSSHPVFGNAMFLLSVIGLSLFLGWMRRRSASVWPCALLHASHNFFFLHGFDPVRQTDPVAGWLVGEQGALLVLAQWLLACVAVQLARRK